MELNLILTALGIVVTLVFQTWGVVKYLQDKNNSTRLELQQQINELKQIHVHKDDHREHREYVDRRFMAIQDTISSNFTALNSRLDYIITRLIDRGNKE